MVSSSSSHQCSSFQADRLKIKPCKQQGSKIMPCQQQGARSGPTDGMGQAHMTGGAATSTAITKCPCHTDNSTSYWTNPGIFSPAANLTSYSVGCATAGLGEIQYLIPNALVSPKIAPSVQRIIRDVVLIRSQDMIPSIEKSSALL